MRHDENSIEFQMGKCRTTMSDITPASVNDSATSVSADTLLTQPGSAFVHSRSEAVR